MSHVTTRAWALRLSMISALGAGTVTVTACASVSTEQEVQLGSQYANEINSQIPLVRDATVNRLINTMGDQIARYGKRGINYTFYVVNADAVNAFAVPGGYVYVNRGLIERTANWAELAGVLAHEIGHVEERHGVEQMERMQNANLGLNLAYVLLGRTPGGVEQAAIQVGGSAVFARYSRDAENEADRVAIPLMLSARVNPNGLTTMFNRLMTEQQRSPSSVEQWFSTHPTTNERIAATQAEISRLSAAQIRNTTSTSSLHTQIRNRLRQLPAAPRTQSGR